MSPARIKKTGLIIVNKPQLKKEIYVCLSCNTEYFRKDKYNLCSKCVIHMTKLFDRSMYSRLYENKESLNGVKTF